MIGSVSSKFTFHDSIFLKVQALVSQVKQITPKI